MLQTLIFCISSGCYNEVLYKLYSNCLYRSHLDSSFLKDILDFIHSGGELRETNAIGHTTLTDIILNIEQRRFAVNTCETIFNAIHDANRLPELVLQPNTSSCHSCDIMQRWNYSSNCDVLRQECMTPLGAALLCKSSKIDVLVNAALSRNVHVFNGYTALMVACHAQNVEVVTIFMNAGHSVSDIFCKEDATCCDYTPLMFATHQVVPFKINMYNTIEAEITDMHSAQLECAKLLLSRNSPVCNVKSKNAISVHIDSCYRSMFVTEDIVSTDLIALLYAAGVHMSDVNCRKYYPDGQAQMCLQDMCRRSIRSYMLIVNKTSNMYCLVKELQTVLPARIIKYIMYDKDCQL